MFVIKQAVVGYGAVAPIYSWDEVFRGTETEAKKFLWNYIKDGNFLTKIETIN